MLYTAMKEKNEEEKYVGNKFTDNDIWFVDKTSVPEPAAKPAPEPAPAPVP